MVRTFQKTQVDLHRTSPASGPARAKRTCNSGDRKTGRNKVCVRDGVTENKRTSKQRKIFHEANET